MDDWMYQDKEMVIHLEINVWVGLKLDNWVGGDESNDGSMEGINNPTKLGLEDGSSDGFGLGHKYYM